ncbi:DUF4031 domain-containing protein [Kytococcus sedentarius]|uniref:DUF4031 domain-containing protein n=1 Tax=Kytococcus sedentarius TaxID=1276 RepID=UPI0035BBF074
MTLRIDAPVWPAHGLRFSHLVSDLSWRDAVTELQDFAARLGLDERFFDGDHQDVPETAYAACVAAGAVPTPGRELVRVLARTGQRLPKRKGERCLARRVDGLPGLTAPHLLDVVRSPHRDDAATARGWAALGRDAAGAFTVLDGGTGSHGSRAALGHLRVWVPEGAAPGGEELAGLGVRVNEGENRVVLVRLDLGG